MKLTMSETSIGDGKRVRDDLVQRIIARVSQDEIKMEED